MPLQSSVLVLLVFRKTQKKQSKKKKGEGLSTVCADWFSTMKEGDSWGQAGVRKKRSWHGGEEYEDRDILKLTQQS